MTDQNKEGCAAVAGCLFLIFGSVLWIAFIGVGQIVAEGFLISLLWDWFVTPLGVPAIGTAQAIGLSALLSLVKSSIVITLINQHTENMKYWKLVTEKTGMEPSSPTLYEIFVKPVLNHAAGYALILLIAYVAKGYMG